ncbi:uncharacterized protein METZ01_LOCUS486513, partial [marine metagenome]
MLKNKKSLWITSMVLFITGTVFAQPVGLTIKNVNILPNGSGTLDINMINQAGCSYCSDKTYNEKAHCENYGSSAGNTVLDATWNFDATMDINECTVANGVYFDGIVGGFQFELYGIALTGASGGSQETNDFTVSTSARSVLGFSLSGTTIPAGDSVLVQVSFTDYGIVDTTATSYSICFGEDTGTAGGTAMADAAGGYINTEWGVCWCAAMEGTDMY